MFQIINFFRKERSNNESKYGIFNPHHLIGFPFTCTLHIYMADIAQSMYSCILNWYETFWNDVMQEVKITMGSPQI